MNLGQVVADGIFGRLRPDPKVDSQPGVAGPEDSDADKKVIVITGASDGIGRAAAAQLAVAGHTIVAVGRNPQKTRSLAEYLGPDASVDTYVADFTELDQVAELGAVLGKKYPHIDVLANNAGGVFGEPVTTIDGFERTPQVNYLAGFLLTELLAPNLAGGGVVINTSSIAAKEFSDFKLGSFFTGASPYQPMTAYGDAKLACALHAQELSRRKGGEGIFGVSFHPGVIASNFADGYQGSLIGRFYKNGISRAFMEKPSTAAARLRFLAEGTVGKDWVPGGYYERNRRAPGHHNLLNIQLAAQLYDKTEEALSPWLG